MSKSLPDYELAKGSDNLSDNPSKLNSPQKAPRQTGKINYFVLYITDNTLLICHNF